MKILKFGGTSVGSIDNLNNVLKIISNINENYSIIVSAFSGVTNLLQEIAHQSIEGKTDKVLQALRTRHLDMIEGLGLSGNNEVISYFESEYAELEQVSRGVYALQELTDKTVARIMAKGELLSSAIITAYFKANNLDIERLDSRLIIRTEGDYLNSKVDFKTTNTQAASIQKNKNYILPGFIASNEAGEDMLLGRGGSDYTASIIGAAINADQIELWSDVNGMQNANPRIVKQARRIGRMSYEEAFEIAYFGAKVLYPPAIKPAMWKNIPVMLKNTVQPSDIGTIIHNISEERKDSLLGVSTLGDISIINVTGVGMSREKGFARKVFQALEQKSINIILISQSCSEQSICMGLSTKDAIPAKEAIETVFSEEIEQNHINPVEIIDNQVILALIGDQMKEQVGLSGNIFTTLGENNININAIAQGSSERNISIVINEKDEHKALNVVHERFFQDTIKKIHLFVFGKGNVGHEFIDILQQQSDFIKEQFKTEVRLVMVTNSKQYLLKESGLSKDEYSEFNDRAVKYNSLDELVQKIKSLNLRNTVIVDNTASYKVSELYPQFFKESYSLATCNKIASSSELSNYKALKALTKKHNCRFLYETAVGASLPVIKTIQNIVMGGDKIKEIQAVLSGSLNFIFNNYNGEIPFVEIVKQAMEQGYTEPDPRIDLSGLDVRRKLLILARECGKAINMEDVKFDSFLPDGALEVDTVDDFLAVLEKEEAFFQQKYKEANDKNHKLKVVAQMKDNQYVVGLHHIEPSSSFYNLDGSDNIVSLLTNLYNPQPLIVKGAGAGARVTAAGVFSDFLHIINQY